MQNAGAPWASWSANADPVEGSLQIQAILPGHKYIQYTGARREPQVSLHVGWSVASWMVYRTQTQESSTYIENAQDRCRAFICTGTGGWTPAFHGCSCSAMPAVRLAAQSEAKHAWGLCWSWPKACWEEPCGLRSHPCILQGVCWHADLAAPESGGQNQSGQQWHHSLHGLPARPASLGGVLRGQPSHPLLAACKCFRQIALACGALDPRSPRHLPQRSCQVRSGACAHLPRPQLMLLQLPCCQSAMGSVHCSPVCPVLSCTIGGQQAGWAARED